MVKTKTFKLDFKRGDDFRLDFTLKDTNTAEAIAAKATWDAEIETLTALQEADLIDQAAIDAQQIIVDAAEDAYEALILMDITGWVLTSQIRRQNELIGSFTIDDTNFDIGKFTLIMDKADTALWRVCEHDVDIQFGRTTGTISSQTFKINVMKDVTYV